ncbi:flagellar hook-length control protein FliK [Herbaspirillum rubrisubalbicans]|uniref:Flagellar hook-length control protein FliK n=1 Tax=Herbaspirillum rubrisubalbicans Os34 TaxID=1235827 RepID=A0A6M3ZQ45_9BURK|nr:flagellar hook-length control protein FliK [Herbaspirillum rubrisubalbicans]MCP1572100.1 flagellar hook-length control protein FliK [Herbaspirillum rubrisubalbicans]NQE48567.1 flagellar hook-length control protein [Herbaspirillum rubrisubalbicans]QJQ00744.1 flagellar hook-length control protein FliK [Herbaspirillum rubrisubalbicans Os34]
MNTSLPLLNVITGSQAATGARSGNPADSFTADVPFNQVLNSQVSTRLQDNQAQSRQAEQAAANQATANQAAANQQAQANASASKSNKTEGSEQKDQVSDKDKDSDDDTSTQASAELLALVANIAQNAVKPVSEGKSQNTDADLLAQAKRGGAKLSLADEQQAMLDKKDGKVDLTALQNAMNAAKGKQDAATELAGKGNVAEANAPVQAGKDGKAAVDLGAAKLAPKDDATTLAARAQLSKATPELTSNAAKQDLPQATPTPVVLPAMQQTLAANQPQAVFAPAYSDKIQANVGSAGWNQALGSKITWMASAGMQSASLSLNPPDLGPMQVVLNVHNQQADATFITAQPEVKQALEAAMPKLREMMDQAGIQLGQANVQTGMPNQQQGAGNGQPQARNSSSGSFGQDQDGDAAITGTTTASASTSGLGLVDTFA